MSKINRHPVRRTAAGVLAGALALSGAVAAGTPAFAATGFALERVQGNDRYETSAAIAAAFGQSTNIILASGESGRTPDALAANFLAGLRSAPVLLTRRDTTPEPVLAQLRTLRAGGATRITVVGGPVAVSDAQLESLRGLGFTVDRVSGANRYETAAAVAVEGETGEAQSASNVGIIASGVSTIDALAGGPLSYKGRHPLFLVTRDDAPGATIAALRATGVTSVFILGGEAVVGPRVVAELAAAGITVRERLFGANRSETSAAIANRLIADFGFSANTFNLASGVNEGIDALGGAALSGKENRVLLITNTAASAAPVTAFATARAATLTQAGRIFGGEAAVAGTLETGIETSGRAAQQFQTLNVVPTDTQRLTLVAESGTPAVETGTTTEQNADNRSYTVSGLNDALRYRITLVNGTSIQGAGTGTTFRSSAIGTTPETFAVDTGTDIADITAVGGINAQVSGTPGSTLNTATVSPVNGSITFTIDGKAAGTVVPLVYVDGGQGGTATTGGASNRLETSATAAGAFAAVTETFGIGGATVYVQPAAQPGQIAANTTVETVDKANDQFASSRFTFTFDANDVFEIGGTRVTQAVFEAALSGGDVVSGTVATDPSLPSTFDLDDRDPAQAATPSVSVGTGANSNDVTITVTVPDGVDAVQFQRAPVTNGQAGTFATVATETATDDVATTNGIQVVFNDNDLAAGTYAYRAILVNDGDTGAPSASVNATTTNPATADTTAPTIADTRVGTNTGSAFLLDNGDTFLLALSEAVAAPSSGDTIRVTDADGTVVDIVAGGGNFALNTSTTTINGTAYAAGRVLTVTRGTADVVVVAGSQTGLGLPATVTQQSGTTDAAGNQLNVGGSADVTIDTESGTVETADTTAPTITNAVAVNATTVTLTISEAVTVSGGGTVVDDNFFYDEDGVAGGEVRADAATLTNPTTITLTFPAGTVTTGAAADEITYADANPAEEAGDPIDAARNQLANETGEPVDNA